MRTVDISVQLSGSHELHNEIDADAHHTEHMNRKERAVKWHQTSIYGLHSNFKDAEIIQAATMLTRLRSPDEPRINGSKSSFFLHFDTPVISYDFCLCDNGQLPSFDHEALYVLGLLFGHYQTEFMFMRGRNHENVSCLQDTLYQGKVLSDDRIFV